MSSLGEKMVRPWIFVFLVGQLLLVSSPLYGSDYTRNGRVDISIENNVATIVVDWRDRQSTGQVMPACNIKDDMNVVVLVKNFNFIHFDLEVDVSAKTIVAYQVLNDVWKQMLSLPSGALIAEL